jgi:YbbR domain-containing protein
MEFNPDGSLKLTGSAQARRKTEKEKMNNEKAVLVKRCVINHTAPKKCSIQIILSDAIENSEFVERYYSKYKENTETPTTLRVTSEKEFELEVGSHLRRCQDCNKFIGHFKETFEGNVIDKKGNCTFKGHNNMW